MKTLVLLTLLFCGCTDPSATRSTLTKAGFTDITTTGYSSFVCGKDDSLATGFQAKNSRGETVTGTVCCGLLFKGCTIRF